MVNGTSVIEERKPSHALALSLLLPGLGHVYGGQLPLGLLLAFLSSLPILLLLILLSLRPSSSPWVFLFLLLISILVAVFAAVDAFRLARRHGSSYVLKDYNRPSVYLLLVLLSTGGVLGLVFYARDNFIEAYRVPVAAMIPTIFPGDRVLADKIAYRNTPPQYGDIVVFPNPANRHVNFIKRLVALPGDTVEIRDNRLYLNGVPLSTRKIKPLAVDTPQGKLSGWMVQEANHNATYSIFLEDDPSSTHPVNFGPVKVPDNYGFTLNDNRRQVHDSRTYGFVPLVCLKARADYLYFPAGSWSRLGGLLPNQSAVHNPGRTGFGEAGKK